MKTQVTNRICDGYFRPTDQPKLPKFSPVTVLRGLHHDFALTTQRVVVAYVWNLLGCHTFCTLVESCWRYAHSAKQAFAGYHRRMTARNPFVFDRDQTERDTEYGFGAGKFPDPRFDYSGGGSISRIPIADPTRHEQELELAMLHRLDLANPNDQPSPYVMGNTDRFGAQPPLVRERKAPKYKRPKPAPPNRMKRAW